MPQELNIHKLKVFPVGRSLFVLFLLFLGGFFLCVFLTSILGMSMGMSKLALIRWSVVLQNLLAFMMPAFFMSLFLWGKPLRFLKIDKAPSVLAVAGMVVIYVAMMPAMNWIVAWNESVVLPDWLAPHERWLKDSEAAAKAVTARLVDVSSIPEMLMAILYVGILTGMGEELFFRGALQNVLLKGMRNKHIAVWMAAVLFSALHLQFYGFVPRLLLGAFFGYALLWSGSLWTPIIGHAMNNAAVVVSSYLVKCQVVETDLSVIGAEQNGTPVLAVASIVVTLLLMWGYCMALKSQKKHNDGY